MSGTDVDLTTLLEQVIGVALQRMAGPVIARVESHDAATARVSVTPLVPLHVGGKVVMPPTLQSVPVARYGGSGVHISTPLPAGSLVRLIPLGHDHGEWFSSGAPNVPPTSYRRFSLSDLVAEPLYPLPAATPPDPTDYHATDGVLAGGWRVGSGSASKACALHGDSCPAAAAMSTWMSQVEAAINTLAPGSVAPLSTVFAPTAIATITATSSRLKAE